MRAREIAHFDLGGTVFLHRIHIAGISHVWLASLDLKEGWDNDEEAE
jgi:hypothetical protein